MKQVQRVRLAPNTAHCDAWPKADIRKQLENKGNNAAASLVTSLSSDLCFEEQFETHHQRQE
jgi:hypothetical protein